MKLKSLLQKKSINFFIELLILFTSYVAAAEILAESSDSFEAIVLNFLKGGAESRNGLKRFLELKLNQLQETSVIFFT